MQGYIFPMEFSEKIYGLCREIPKGKVTSYGEIAKKLNSRAYRSVGQALNKSRNKDVPCHRIVNSKGGLHGFATGLKNKAKLLRKEGIKIKNNKIINFERVLYKF